MDPGKRVAVSYRVTPDRFDVRITDEGPGFNPDDVPDPTDPPTSSGPAAAACCSSAVS